MKNTFIYLILYFGLISLVSCRDKIGTYDETRRNASIYPPYESTVIPCNIAPLNFSINEDYGKYIVQFVVSGKDSFEISTKKNLDIPLKKWKRILEKNRGADLIVKIFGLDGNKYMKYNDIKFHISTEPADPYIAYRLIEPGYEVWGKMGLYQRCIENFDELPILVNNLTDNNCMNCHSFRNNDPNYVTFHLRGNNAGTIVAKNGDVKKLNTKMPWTISAGVYPRWHPDGDFIAFSTNKTSQGFLTAHTNKIEVFDMASDIVLYNTKTNTMSSSDLLRSPKSYETFPEWDPEGKYLYFCSAPASDMPQEYQSTKYDLLRIGFNKETGEFNNKVDTLISAQKIGKSISMARISPDGEHLVFCMADYGTFPIWHRENDLYHLNLTTGEIADMKAVNSDETDSYHSWSSNGRWLVFSSRRLDGAYTRLHIAYFDTEGNWHTPILLPQKNPEYYDYLLKSYNVPEFITGKVKISPYEFAEAGKSSGIQVQ